MGANVCVGGPTPKFRGRGGGARMITLITFASVLLVSYWLPIVIKLSLTVYGQLINVIDTHESRRRRVSSTFCTIGFPSCGSGADEAIFTDALVSCMM